MAHEWVNSVLGREAHKCRSCQAYYMRDTDSWRKINYSHHAADWMEPLVRGNDTGLVCIPANWCVCHRYSIQILSNSLYFQVSWRSSAHDVRLTHTLYNFRSNFKTLRQVYQIECELAWLGNDKAQSPEFHWTEWLLQVSPQVVEQLWKDTFTYCYRHVFNPALVTMLIFSFREEEEFIFPITIHPDVSG